MPDDVSLAKPPDTVNDAWYRGYRYWEACFVIVTAVVSAAPWLNADDEFRDRLGATLCVAGLAAWYLVMGRRMVLRQNSATGAIIGYQAGVLALLAGATMFSNATSFLLFAVVPHLFWLAEPRHVLPFVLAVNFTPALADILDGQPPLSPLLVAMATGTASAAIGVWTHRVIAQSMERAGLIADLRASRSEVEELSRQAGATAERERLAAELHDTIAQGLAAIIMLTQSARRLDGPAAHAQLDLLEQTARSHLAEVRDLVAAWSSDIDNSIVVEQELRALSGERGARFSLTGRPRPLSSPVAVLLLRTVQEALTNAGKHAQGAVCQVGIEFKESTVSVGITDAGPGFDPSAAASGFGLTGMRNRAAGLGGQCTIDSAPGRGTTVSVEIPTAETVVAA